MINGDRIKQARELRGLTQIQFAASIGVNQSAIAQIESGRITPGEQVFQRIILQTGFPADFFNQPNSVDFPLGSLLFRARASVTLRERCQARQYARTVYEVAEKMGKNITGIPLRLPRMEDKPDRAAIQTRSFLSLSPDEPILNLISGIERSGTLVMALPTELKKRDAFSAWVGSDTRRPVIVICNNTVPGDRLRFSIAHELGHLVIHQSPIGDTSTIEREANLFAGEFLMPKEAMLKEITKPVTLPNLLPLKARWKVSIQALIRRAYELEIITPRQYKYLMYQLSLQGWRTKEPLDIPTEKPRMISQMAELLYGVPINYKELADDVNLPPFLIKRTLEAHAVKKKVNDNEEGMNTRAEKVISITKKTFNSQAADVTKEG